MKPLLAIAILPTLIGHALAINEWTLHSPSAPALAQACVHAEGKYVTVCRNGVTGSSPDGFIWTWTPSPTASHLTDVDHGNDTFVAVGDGGAMVSDDGVNWSLSSTGGFVGLKGVTYAQGKFVAVGGNINGSFTLISTDGLTWTQPDTRDHMGGNAITYGGGRFVVAGYDGRIRYSLDGLIWVPVFSGSTNHDYLKVAWNGSVYVAMAQYGQFATSPDGITWTLRTSGPPTDTYDLQVNSNNQFVAASGSSLHTSSDGITWTPTTTGATDIIRCFEQVETSPGGPVMTLVIGSDSIRTTTNLTAWNVQNPGPRREYYGVTYRAGQFVADGYNNVVKVSTDGQVWTDGSSNLALKDRWVSANGLYVAAQSNYSAEGIMTSADAITWTRRTSSGAAITHDGSNFYAINSTDGVMKSSNGVNWAVIASNVSGFDRYPASLNWFNNLLVAGFNGNILSSPDGVTWTSRQIPYWGCASIAQSATTLVAVGGAIYTSTDGINWTERLQVPTQQETLLDVAYGDGYFVAVGNRGRILTSPDGANWTEQRSGTDAQLTSVAYANGRFAIVGYDGIILSAPSVLPGGPPPVFSSHIHLRGVTGTAFNHMLEISLDPLTTNPPTNTFSASNLPAGLTLDPGTGVISGTAPAAGRHQFTVTASTAFGVTVQGLTLDVAAPPPAWTLARPAPLDMAPSQLIHDGSRFVASSDYGAVLESADGSSWTRHPTGLSSDLKAIASANGKYLAVGDGGAAVLSTDASLTSWSVLNLRTTKNLTGAAHGNSVHVVVGSEGFMARSTDGLSWTVLEPPTVSDFSGVSYLGGRFVAISSDYHYKVYSSTDGITWTSAFLNSATNMSSIAFDGTYYVVVDESSTNCWYSTNATSWTSKYIDSNQFRSIVHDGTQFIVGGTGGIYTATNPTATWTKRIDWRDQAADYDWDFDCMAHGGGKTLAISRDAVIISSTNGINWQIDSDSLGQTISSLKFINGQYVATCGNKHLLLSQDGFDWSILNAPDALYKTVSIAFSGEAYVALSTSGPTSRIYQSTDLTGWNLIGSAGSYLKDILYHDGLYISVGDTGAIRTSTDLSSWTTQSSGVTKNLERIVRINGLFFALGADSTILKSSNGINWSSGSSSTGAGIKGLAFGGSKYVAVGEGGLILYSSDGASWTPTYMPGVGTLNDVAYGDGIFWAVGDKHLCRSTDGINWSVYSNATSLYKTRILWDGERFLTGGVGEAVLSSTSSIQRPIISYPIPFIGTVGAALLIAPTTLQNSPTTLTVSNLPLGMSFNPENGQFSGVPTQEGTCLVKVTAANSQGSVDIIVAIRLSNWVSRNTGNTSHLYAVTHGDGVFMACGLGSTLLRSTDAVHWTPVNGGITGNYTDAIHASGYFFMMANNGDIARSPDGLTWTVLDTPLTSLGGICEYNGTLLAVGTGKAIRSTNNGDGWTVSNIDIAHAQYSVACGNGVHVSGTAGGWFSRSTDGGQTWTSVSSGNSSPIYSITYANGEFIAVQGKRILRSTNGLSWSVTTAAADLNHVEVHGNTWYMVGYNSLQPKGGHCIISSDENFDHPRYSITNQILRGITYGSGKVVLVGDSGTLLTSNVSSVSSARSLGFDLDSTSLSYQIDGAFGASSYTASGLPDGLNLNPATGTITGMPLMAGIHEFLVGVTFNGITSMSAVTLNVPSLYEWWRHQHFTEGQRANAGIIGDYVDHEGDAVSNLLEFALGLDPNQADTGMLPRALIVEDNSEKILRMQIRRPRYSYGEVNLQVRCSSDLSFSTDTFAELVGAPVDNGDGTDTWHFKMPGAVTSPANSKGFMRIEVDNLNE